MSDLPLHRTMQDDEIDRLKAQLKETEEKGRVLMDMCRDLKARVTGIKQIIATEPELPGEMPEEMWQAFVDAINEGDRAFVMTALRVAVKETKDCILERIREAERAGGEK